MQTNLRKFVAEWILPEEQPAPKGEKLILLTVTGTATMGFWDDNDCVAYAPLLKMTDRVKLSLKQKQSEVQNKYHEKS